MADQWDKVAKALVEATYARGPQAAICAVAGAYRQLSLAMVKAGTEMALATALAETIEARAANDTREPCQRNPTGICGECADDANCWDALGKRRTSDSKPAQEGADRD